MVYPAQEQLYEFIELFGDAYLLYRLTSTRRQARHVNPRNIMWPIRDSSSLSIGITATGGDLENAVLWNEIPRLSVDYVMTRSGVER
jgi:hypothetical protein